MSNWPYGYGLCYCGCGQRTGIAHQTLRCLGWIKGEPKRFIQFHSKPPHKRVFRDTDPDYIIDASSECWVWQKGQNGAGYGVAWNRSTKTKPLAHRAYYEAHKGPIPASLVIDHLCRNRLCVNPDHLEAVENIVNVLRGSPMHNTHCKNGHEFTPDNTHINRRNGRWRKCRACHRLHEAKRRMKIKQAAQ